MQKSLEIEMKFEILDDNQLQAFLKDLQLNSKKRVKDIYLDTQDGALFKRGIFIRIRNDKTLDFKFNADDFETDHFKQQADHTSCDEYNFDLPLQSSSLSGLNEVASILSLKNIKKASLEEFKMTNNLVKSVIIDRERKTYEHTNYEVVYDAVDNLGNFLEIEYKGTETADIKKIKQEIRDFMNILDLKHINTGYNELYWRKHDFNLYLQGKYMLDEDFEKYRGKNLKN